MLQTTNKLHRSYCTRVLIPFLPPLSRYLTAQ